LPHFSIADRQCGNVRFGAPLAGLLLRLLVMPLFVLCIRRSLLSFAGLAVLLLVNSRAEAQGVGFQGGATVDPEQVFVGTHFETGELFRNFRFRPGIDGGFGGDYSLGTINIEFLYHIEFGRSGWSLYQGGGPAIVLLRRDEETSIHAGSFITFGFAHENGFFTDFKLGNGNAPTLKFAVGYTVRKRNP
jgi:hypothetical protein